MSLMSFDHLITTFLRLYNLERGGGEAGVFATRHYRLNPARRPRQLHKNLRRNYHAKLKTVRMADLWSKMTLPKIGAVFQC